MISQNMRCMKGIVHLNKKFNRFKVAIFNREKEAMEDLERDRESEIETPSMVEFNAFLSNVRLKNHLFISLIVLDFDLTNIFRMKPMIE